MTRTGAHPRWPVIRAAAWVAVTALIVLVGRAVSYTLAGEGSLRAQLEGRLGGPGPVVVLLVAFAMAAALAALALWLAALGVRERHRLAAPGGAPRPRLRLRRIPVRAAALFVASALAFAAVESYLHWRAGLGFHGLHCLT